LKKKDAAKSSVLTSEVPYKYQVQFSNSNGLLIQ